MSGRRWRSGRQSPKVKDGKVQKKQRWDRYYREYDLPTFEGEVTAGQIPIVVEAARKDSRHLVSESELRRFVRLIPEWDRYAEGLKVLVLGEGSDRVHGWHGWGVICLHAWTNPIEEVWDLDFFEEHEDCLERLMVPSSPISHDEVEVRFDKTTAAGFLLMHVFLHELGHHYDRMMTKQQRFMPGGEDFADTFASEMADKMWDKFFREFKY